MDQTKPILMWFRRDLRLRDHEALTAAAKTGKPIVPVFLCDELVESLGAAPKWRLGLGVAAFSKTLSEIGSKLILRRGPALEALRSLVAETGADVVYWSRAYDTDAIERDTGLKAGLIADGIDAQSFSGHLLYQPWEVKNKSGLHFKVYSPFWRSVSSSIVISEALKPVTCLNTPSTWPQSDDLDSWKLGGAMKRGAAVVAPHVCVGETAALDRLHTFIEQSSNTYKAKRDFPGGEHTSRLSENLTYGEISPRTVWHAGRAALENGAQGAEHFLKELVWREFAYHLMFHFRPLATANWKADWAQFPWQADGPDAERWRRGQTGVDFVDAGMRELYVTGTMHNRVRMIAASYLTKHLLTDWRVGRKWFEECLIDWDPASNAMGWQWVAGCGPDAAPYFRIFNPETQGEKFDADATYRNRFLDVQRSEVAASFFDAVPESWNLTTSTKRPKPLISLADGRNRALSALESFKLLKS